MPKGSRVNVLEKRSEWFGVALPPQVPVFVSRAYLKAGPSESQARVTGRQVHVRSGPSAAYASLGFLDREAVVQIRSQGPEWAAIEPPDFCRGWIHQSYVTFLERLPAS